MAPSPCEHADTHRELLEGETYDVCSRCGWQLHVGTRGPLATTWKRPKDGKPAGETLDFAKHQKPGDRWRCSAPFCKRRPTLLYITQGHRSGWCAEHVIDADRLLRFAGAIL